MRVRIERRCPARLHPKVFIEDWGMIPYHGRCDLPRGHEGPHVLERGGDEIRFEVRVLGGHDASKPSEGRG